MQSVQKRLFLLFVVIIGLAIVCASQTTPVPAQGTGWKLVWSDEFSGPNGSAVEGSKWVLETGGEGWGNEELEYYTDRTANVSVHDGNLVIKAAAEKYTGPDGVTRNYTSARLKTLGKFSQTYGRFEARIKVPHGQGMWPAFWMLGDDIMENIGKEPAIIHGSIHGPGYVGSTGIEAPYTLTGKQRFADDFHVFAIEWDPNSVSFLVDQDLYVRRTRADLKPGWKWVFDKPFFLILNLAVGGDWPGNPDSSTVFPQSMLVDYVRVYQKTDPPKRESAQR
jgi:beta-glucanase (GH16 family)